VNETLASPLETLWQSLTTFVTRNVLDWHVLLQLVVVGLAYGVAWLLSRRLRPALEPYLATRLREGSRLRALGMTFAEELHVVLMLPVLWLVLGVMRSLTWPSYSYLVGVAGTLASVWVIIRLTSTAIRHPLIGRGVAIAAWAVAAMHITGVLEPSVALLDSLALTFGELRISLLTVIQGGILLALFLWGALALSRGLERRITAIPDLAPSVQVLLGMGVRIMLVVLAVVVALNSVGVDLTALAVLSGAIGVGIGFGLQKVISNLVSGFILLLDRSIKPGDVIQLGETFGWVTSLGARYVSLVTRDGKEYLVPNEDLITQQVVNWSYTNELVRIETTIRASYDADPHLVRRVAIEAAARPARVVPTQTPVCHIKSFGDSSLEYLLRFWIRDPKNGVENVTGEVLLAVWDAFREHGVRIPYPQREVTLRDASGTPGLCPP